MVVPRNEATACRRDPQISRPMPWLSWRPTIGRCYSDLSESYSSRNSLERHQEWRALSEAIKRHMRVEADVFYPAFLDATEDSLTHFVASVGHESIAAEMRDVLERSTSAEIVSRIRSLKKVFLHHVSDMEGEGGMFDLARRSTMNQELLAQWVRARYAAWEAAAGKGEYASTAACSIR